jgi:hypothetical protein
MNKFHYLGEPLLLFGHDQLAEDPHDGALLQKSGRFQLD